MEIGTYKVKDNDIDKHNYTYKNMTNKEIQEQAKKHRRNTDILDVYYSFVRGAEWAKDKVEKECPSFEQFKKCMVIISGVHYDNRRVRKMYNDIKEHWND